MVVIYLGCKSPNENSLAKPIINVKNDSLDLGNIKLGDTIDFNILLENTGNAPYQIKNILGSCGCLDFDYDPNSELDVSKQLQLPLKFIAKKSGLFQNTITIKGNTTPSFTVFHFTANIEDTKIE